MRVDFYQLSRDPVEQVLPQVAARILAEGERLLIVSDDRGQLDRISDRLWNAGPTRFLAHDHADQPMPEVQPILLAGNCEAQNGATRIALSDGHFRDDALKFTRIFYFFDDSTLAEARASWRALADQPDAERHFWKQADGGWREGP